MPTDDTHPNDLRTSDAGIILIKRFEPFSHQRKITWGGMESIGYGHIVQPVDQKLDWVDEQQAIQLLRQDVRCYEIYVNASVRVVLAQHRFDALVSLVFDVGMLAFENSALRQAINGGDFCSAVRELRNWGIAGAQVSCSSLDRRAMEAQLFRFGRVIL